MISPNSEPAGQVRSMEEFFAIAHAIETDAAARYEKTSRVLRDEGFEQMAELFEHLAGLERAHVGQVEQWASRRELPAIADEPWPIPDTFDAPPEEVARSRLMTPYRVLASAVRHEQRAFAFWTYVAAHADSQDVRRAAEKMALEELEHASLLRRERRNAYRLAKAHHGEEDASISLTSLATTERHLAGILENAPAGDGRTTFAKTLAAKSRTAAEKLQTLAVAHSTKLNAPTLPPEQADDVAALSEYLAEAYLRLAESSRDEHVLAAAQELAAMAINRLGLLDPAFPLSGTPSTTQKE